jgi:hypothetical protein
LKNINIEFCKNRENPVNKTGKKCSKSREIMLPKQRKDVIKAGKTL